MRKTASLLIVIMLLLTCGSISGCSDQATEPVAQKRDSVNISSNASLKDVDCHGSRNLQDMLVKAQLYEGLYYLNETKLVYEPRVAKSYTISDDGKVYTFKINPKAKFHNGDKVMASDVVFSFDRAAKKPGYTGFTYGIVDVSALDDQTVQVTLQNPSAVFMTNMTSIFILSEREVLEQGDAFGTKVTKAGTGPYMLTELDNAVEWKLEAFPDYYRGEATIKYINYRPIPDASAGLIAFEAGELDWYVAPISNIDSLESNPNFKTEVVPANHITWVNVNPYVNEALGNDLVRKAIGHAIDKEAMNLAAFDGHAQTIDWLSNPKYNVGAPTEFMVYEYNPEKSKQLLAEAGYPNGVYVGKIVCFMGSHFEKCAQVLHANLNAVGIKCDLEWNEQNTSIERGIKQDYDLTVCGGMGTGDYDWWRRMAHSSMAGTYFVKFEGDKFDYKRIDELLERGVEEMDPVKRKAIYTEVNNMILETGTWFPLLHKVQLYAWNKDLNVINNPNYYYVYDWSWN